MVNYGTFTFTSKGRKERKKKKKDTNFYAVVFIELSLSQRELHEKVSQ